MMASRRGREPLADGKAKEDARRREIAERCRRQLMELNCERSGSSRGRVDQLLELRRKAERKRAMEKKCREANERNKRPTSSEGEESKKGETLAELRARDKQKKKHLELLRKSKSKLGSLDRVKPERPRRDVMADLKERNLEMKRQLAAKMATRTPIHLRSSNSRERPESNQRAKNLPPRPSSATRPKVVPRAMPTRPSSAKFERPRTATTPEKPKRPTRKPMSPATSERDEIVQLRREVEDLKRLIVEMKKNPNCKSQDVECNPQEPRDLTDPTLEGTRELLENAYKSFAKMESVCPDFLNSDIKRAAKVLIGLAAGFVPGSPYHELYKRALEEKMASEPKRVNSEQIVLRPGDIDPDATTVVNVIGGDFHEPTNRDDYSVKVVHARPAPYGSQNTNSLTDAEEELRIPSTPEEGEDPTTSEVRSMLQSLRAPKTPKDELIDLVGEIRRPRTRRRVPQGRPLSPLRDFEQEEDCLVNIKQKSPQKLSESDRKRKQIERKTKAELARIRREARAKAGLDCSDEEIIFDDECEEKTPPPEICLGPYGAELVRNVLPRSKYARELGLESEGEGVDLCLGSPY